MRQLFSRLIVGSGLLALACATAVDESPLGGSEGNDAGTSSRAGTPSIAGSTSNSAGTSSASGSPGVAGSASSEGGKGGTGTTAFGGTSTSGGTATAGTTGSAGKGGTGAGGTGSGGTASGGAGNGGTASGGKGGAASGGTAAGGTASGGGGSGSGGSASITCNGVADWSSKAYQIGDTVASTCSGVFASPCPSGQSHKFECNPAAGSPALAWCQQREPGVGNGWGEAWIDKGQCQK
jgi:hypothetical protein